MDKVNIDGVDVSECDNLAILQDRMTDEEFTFCNAYQEDCSERENCHYKQLQRLKHQYADVLKLAKENADSNEYCLQELEKENERLKEEITKLSDPRYQISKVNEGYYNRMNTYKQALQEIKGIAEDRTKTEDYLLGQEYTDLVDNIIAKINEVIGAESWINTHLN